MAQNWSDLKDDELLKLRICDLELKIEDSELEPIIQKLYQELTTQGFKHFKPKIYLGDEWFSPEGVPFIAIPFYLAHPRLRALERRMMLEVEGEAPEECLKLLRHESGHCFDHAYRFSRRAEWQSVFGSPEQEYHPEVYRPKPYSRSFVRHLENWYAQAHPDEDFAETFAVWLNPNLNWKKSYLNWHGAYRKLQYIHSLFEEVKDKKPLVNGGSKSSQASRLKITLEKYYLKKRKSNAADYPDFYDEDLKKIFLESRTLNSPSQKPTATQYMKQYHKRIVHSVSQWTGERKYTIEGLVKKLTDRTRELKLELRTNETETHLEVAAYLASLVTHYLFTGKFKRTV